MGFIWNYFFLQHRIFSTESLVGPFTSAVAVGDIFKVLSAILRGEPFLSCYVETTFSGFDGFDDGALAQMFGCVGRAFEQNIQTQRL